MNQSLALKPMGDPKQIHVLHLARWYPHEADPQLGLFIRNQLKCLPPHISSTVIFVWPMTGQAQVQRDEQKDGTLTEIRITYPARRWSAINFLVFFKLCFKEARAVHALRPVQLIHAHILTRVAFTAKLLSQSLHIPYVVSEHWSRYFPEVAGFNGYFRIYYTLRAVGASQGLVLVSQGLRDAMARYNIKHFRERLVPNVVNTAIFKPPLPDARQSNAEALHLVHLSCFDERAKNIEALLEALVLLNADGIQIKLDLIGDGPDRQALQARSIALGLFQQVDFKGRIAQHEVAKMLPDYDFMVQSSRYETFNTAIVEAWACGLPVVSTMVGVFGERYQPFLGVPIASPSVEHIAEALGSLPSVRGSFDAQRLSAFAERHFSPQAVGAAFAGFYQEVLNPSLPPLPRDE